MAGMFFRRFHSPHRTALPLAGDAVFAACALWFIGGLYLDGWAHKHVPELETFFTPWHAVFYAGYFACLIPLLAVIASRRKGKSAWADAVPLGYGPALAGAAVFFLGGIGDMVWHEVFGVEADIEALLSPTHLMLAVGMTLMLSGPLLSWWRRPQAERERGYLRQIPVLISATALASLFTFMTQYTHFVDMLPAGLAPDDGQAAFRLHALGVTGTLLPVAFLFGVFFLLMRRARLPFGALTTVLTLHMLGMGWMRDGLMLLLPACIAGVVGDLLLQALPPRAGSRLPERVFAFCAPAALFALYDAALLSGPGIWWSIHMWAGLPMIAGMGGLLLSLLVWPPSEA